MGHAARKPGLVCLRQIRTTAAWVLMPADPANIGGVLLYEMPDHGDLTSGTTTAPLIACMDWVFAGCTQEHYGSHEGYVDRVRDAVRDLVEQRFRLRGDAARQAQQVGDSDALRRENVQR